ncbi:BAG family molecular chaperone regulator 7-like isoform X1 [Musa acuminata AAA Group]|uniref:BAG family molecular chaperone regulator 7-like isoform X1 n=1 Tax=Musa acuminata AAA Group TaxID=214697 RepID=UPI0031DA6329
MSGFHPFDLRDPIPPTLSYLESSLFTFPPRLSLAPALVEELDHYHYLGFTLDPLNPTSLPPFGFPPQCLLRAPSIARLDLLAVNDPFGFERSAIASLKGLRQRAETELCLRDLSDRVASLEFGLGRARSQDVDRKYTWTAEFSGPKGLGLDRKHRWTATAKAGGERAVKCAVEIKGVEEEEGFDRKFVWATEANGVGKRYEKWTAEFKGKEKLSPLSHTYTWAASAKPREEEEGQEKAAVNKEKKKKGKTEKQGTVHVVEIEVKNPGVVAIRKAFTKRCNKGKKKKELSPQDAALLIQMTFRSYLARRSQILRCLRELAVAKARLKEIRAIFYNFSYRKRVANDAEERQRFSEKIIVLLLTVEAVEGPDYMVRAAKKSMVEELEAMLEVVDPQPSGKLGSMRRRRFDLPDGGPISKEMMAGVTEVVQMLDQE